MKNIKDGIIEIDGITLSGDTTVADLEKIDIDKAVIREHAHGYVEAIFNHPIISDEVAFNVSMRIDHDGDHKIILLNPDLKERMHDAIDASREKQEVCEEWLKRNMEMPPTRDTDDGIFYDFPWGHVHSAAAEHINFGHLEGCILVTYGDDME